MAGIGSRFINPEPNRKHDPAYAIMILVCTALIIYIWLTDPGGAFGYTYTPIILFSLILFVVGFFSGGRLFGEVTFGDARDIGGFILRLGATDALAIGIWLLITSSAGYQSLFSVVASPLSIGGAGLLMGLSGLFFYSIPGVETERTTFSGTLLPTIVSTLRDPTIAAFFGYMAAAVFYFVFNLPDFAYVFAAIGVLFTFSKLANKAIAKHSVTKLIIGVVVTGALFAMWHIHVFGASSNWLILLISAFAFFCGTAFIDIVFGWTMSGRLLQCTNDATVICLLWGLPVYYGLVMLGLYNAIIISLFVVRNGKGEVIA